MNGQAVAFRIGSSIMYHIGEKESEILETLPPKEDLGLDDDHDDAVEDEHQESDGETQGDAKRGGHEEEKQATTTPHEGGESDVDYIDEIAAHGDDDEEEDKAHEQGGDAKAPAAADAAAVEKHEAPTEADDTAKAARLSEIDTALGYVYVSYYEPQCVAMISQKYGYSSMPEFIRRIGCRIRKWLNAHTPVKYQIMANHYLRHKKEHDDDTFRKMTRWVQRTIKDSVKNVKDELHAFFYIQSSIHSQSFGEGQLEDEEETHDDEEEEDHDEDHGSEGSPYVIGRRRGRHHSNKKKHHPHHHHAKSKKKHHKHKAISEIKANPHLHWFPAHPEYHERVNEVATRLAQGDWWPTSPSEVDLTKYSDNALMAPRLDKDINKLIVSVHGGGEILGHHHHHHEKEATSSSSSSESDSENDEDRGKAEGAHENSGDVFDRIYDVDEFDEFIKAMEMDHDDLEEYMSEAIDFFRKKFGVDFTSKDAMRSDANALTIVLPNGIVFEPFAVNRNIKLTASAHGVAASGDGSASSSKDREPHVMMGGFKMCVTRDTSAGSDPQSSRPGLKEGDMAMFGDYVVIPVPDSDEKTKQVLKDIFHDRKEGGGGEDGAIKSETQHHDGESDGEGAGEEDSNNHIKIHFESTSLVKLPTYDQIVARKAARGALKPSGSWLGEGESGKKLLVEGGVISHTLKIDSHHLPDTTAREGMAQHTIKWKLVFEASFGPHNRTHHQHHKKIFCYINDTLSFDPIAQSGGGGGDDDESDD